MFNGSYIRVRRHRGTIQEVAGCTPPPLCRFRTHGRRYAADFLFAYAFRSIAARRHQKAVGSK